MTAKQSNKLAMYNSVLEFLRAFLSSPTATSAFPALAARLAALITLVGKIIEQAAIQEQPLKGRLDRRDQTLGAVAETAVPVAGAVLSYARATEQPELAAQVENFRSRFGRMRRAERVRIAQRVHDAAVPLAAELADYGLTAAMLEDLRARIEAADKSASAPRVTAEDKKVATQQLERIFEQAERLIAEIDPMLLKLQLTDPATHDRYLAARIVYDRPGARQGDEAAGPAEPPATAAGDAQGTTA